MALPDFTQFYTTKLYNLDGITSSQTIGIELEDISGVDDITRPGVVCFGYRDPLAKSTSEWIFYTSITATTGTRGTLNGVIRAFDNSIQALSFKKNTAVAFIVSKYHMKAMRDQIESALPYTVNDIYRQALINPGGNAPENTIIQSGKFVGACNNWSNHINYYGPDAWLIYGSDTTTMASDGDLAGIRLFRWQTSTSTNKVAMMQILEATTSYAYRGNTISFGFVPSFIGDAVDKEDLTVFILAMKASGTADSITNAPITSFGASGTRPTFDTTNYTVLYQADISKTLIDGTYRVTGTTSAVPSDAKNIIFGVVNKDSFYNGGNIYAGFKINYCQMNLGSVVFPFSPRSFHEELSFAKRFYRKSYDYSVTPGSITNYGSVNAWITNAWWFAFSNVAFQTQMRTTPTVTTYNTNNGTSGQYTEINNASVFVANRNTQSYGTVENIFVQPAGVGTVGNVGQFHWTANARL